MFTEAKTFGNGLLRNGFTFTTLIYSVMDQWKTVKMSNCVAKSSRQRIFTFAEEVLFPQSEMYNYRAILH